MPVFRLLSQRRRRPADNPDVYQYDVLPDAFRRQVIYILGDVLGAYRPGRYTSLSVPSANGRWEMLFLRYAREKGVFDLEGNSGMTPYEQCIRHIQGAPAEEVLDFIDCAFHFINEDLRRDPEYLVQVPGRGFAYVKIDPAIDELNQRFREHRIGYQFENGGLIKQTDQYVHEEIVLPALTLLTNPQFRGAQEEFLSAHRHYREQRYKEAISDALKAFESTMKSILDEQNWAYDRTRDTASRLVQVLLEHELIPSMPQSQFAQLRGLLESGLPTVRNRTSDHGQGTEPVTIPNYMAAYALHLAAANIVFLVQADEAYKQRSR